VYDKNFLKIHVLLQEDFSDPLVRIYRRLRGDHDHQRSRCKSIMFLIMPLFMIIIGVIVMRKLVWDLADEVYDCGDTLLVRNRGGERRVVLSNIMNVSASVYMNPPPVTLRLVSGGRMGREISFTPVAAFTLNPFAKNQVVKDLIVRVDRARTHRMALTRHSTGA
jgi:hypothetical protein